MADVPILDKGIDDWGEDEQEKAYDKLQSLKQDFEGVPTKLYDVVCSYGISSV
jgi:hypothetical protein